MPGINLTRDEAAARAGLLTVHSYEVRLELGIDDTTFVSTTHARFACAEPGAETFIDLIAPTVRQVVLNGVRLDPAVVVTLGRIALPSLLAENDLLVEAEGAYMNTGEGLHRFVDPVDKEVYLYTQFEVSDARRAFACFDQPDLKAAHTFIVTGPAHWRVISNSPTPEAAPVAMHVSGRTDLATWHFAPTERVSTYITAICAGPYQGVTGELTSSDGRVIPLGVFTRASLAAHLDADEILDLTRKGIAHYEGLFDRPYPFTKCDHIFVPEYNAGAMENAGAITYTDVYVFRSKVPEAMRERRALTVLHELAHMWFGDLVTMTWWDDLWLNESFAEYASVRCQAETTRWSTAWTTFLSVEKAWAYNQDQLATTHPIVADIRDLADVEVNFDGITYAKGASVLKQLVHYVGEKAFDAGLRKYFATHAWGNTTLRELLAELTATSGRDLQAWAAEWLQTAGVATLIPEIETDASGLITSAAIRQRGQVGHDTLRSHRLVVGGYDVMPSSASGEPTLQRTLRLELDLAGELTQVPGLIGRARPDLVLVNDEDLAYAKIRLDEGSLATALEHLAHFTDPLAATLVWAAAWDMTRDGELGARTFVRLVLANIESVSDPSIHTALLTRQMVPALNSFVAPEFRHDIRVQAGDRLIDLLRHAAPGSDAQLVYARTLALLAITDGQFALLSDLLDGTQTLAGLAVDTDLRWSFLRALVVGAQRGESAIDEELLRDDTASGREHAAAARAALPTPEAKANAWSAVVEHDDLPNSVQGATIMGFTRVNDFTLLAPYVEPYFEAIEQVWATRTSEIASQIVEGLYPSADAGHELLERSDRWLADTPAESSLRRLVIEGRDGVARALRVQERDRA